MRVGAAADIFLPVLVHAGLGHLVDPVVLARDEGCTTWSDAVFQSEVGAVFGDPLRPLRPILDIGHAVLQFPRRLGYEQVGRHPRHVEMAIGRDSAVLHGSSPLYEGSKRLYSVSSG